MLNQSWKRLIQRRPIERCSDFAIPGLPDIANAKLIHAAETHAKICQEGLQLGLVRVLFLGIELPDKRTLCPVRANRTILATNEIQVAAAQQTVVIIGLEKGITRSVI